MKSSTFSLFAQVLALVDRSLPFPARCGQRRPKRHSREGRSLLRPPNASRATGMAPKRRERTR